MTEHIERLSFEQFQPCNNCPDPDNFEAYMTALDVVADYRPAADLLIDSTALYFALEGGTDPQSRTPADSAAADRKQAAILDVVTETSAATRKLDEIRGRLANKLERVDCTVYCGGTIRQCPKIEFAAHATRQSVAVMKRAGKVAARAHELD